MSRNQIILLIALVCNVLMFQNCGQPIPTNQITVYESASESESSGQGLGFKVLSYETDSPANLPAGTDAEDIALTWYSSGQVIETRTRHTTSGDVVDSATLAVFAVDQASVRDTIKNLPDVATFTPVVGTAVACDSGNRRYVAHRRDGSTVVLYEERDCST
ncbi:MAG TPA: hypothetical protein VM432_04550, partial [Bdellovibrionales bacterium]|nr:hypothetical protein [Bdellovibrionales bacterium]